MTDDIWGDVPIYRSAADVPKPSRRSVLAGAAGLFSATAFAMVSGVRSRPAGAAAGDEWADCAGYDAAKGYSGTSTQPCVGAEYSRTWCGTDGWFRSASGTCFVQGPYKACGNTNLGYYHANAWRWYHSGSTWRCADGIVQTCGADPVLKICSWEF